MGRCRLAASPSERQTIKAHSDLRPRRSKRLAGQSIDGPFVHRDRTQGAVEVDRWPVPIENSPFQPRVSPLDRKAGEARLEPGTTKNQAGRVFPFTDTLRALGDHLLASGTTKTA